MAGYGSNETFAAWLTANGFTLPVGAPAPAVLRLRGSNYIDGAYGDRFLGEPTGGLLQPRAWPRMGVPGVPDNLVPDRVIEASYEAALQEAREPESLSVFGSAAQRVKRERVEGAVDVSYADDGGDLAADMTPVFTSIEGLLKPFLRTEAPAVGLGIWSVG